MTVMPSKGVTGSEQFPLLKLESGDGDAAPNPSRDPLRSRFFIPKNGWLPNWVVEFVMVCWIILIVFLVFLIGYIIAGIFKGTNIKKSGLNECANKRLQVYHYQIFEKGLKIRFKQYSEYLSVIANEYPNLCINVCFLENDSRSGKAPRPKFYERLFENMAPKWASKFTIPELNTLYETLLKYPNVNATIASLSCVMDKTPLKNKWRYMPMKSIEFYLRALSVWKNGGIAIDLATYSNKYFFNHYDSRISNIFKQVNEFSHKVPYGEQDATLSFKDYLASFKDVLSDLLNRTFAYENNEEAQDVDPIIRSRRNVVKSNNTETKTSEEKAKPLDYPIYYENNKTIPSQVYIPNNTIYINSGEQPDIPVILTFNDSIINANSDQNNGNKTEFIHPIISIDEIELNAGIHLKEDSVFDALFPLAGSLIDKNKAFLDDNNTVKLRDAESKQLKTNKSNGTEIGHKHWLFYELTLFLQPSANTAKVERDALNQNSLTIDSEGGFIACIGYEHPYLEEVVMSDWFPLKPKIFLHSIYEKLCSGIGELDFCNNFRFI